MSTSLRGRPARRSALAQGLAGLGALLLATAVPAQNLVPLKVRLDWTPWGNHAAIHLAQQKGWFKAAGLDPSIEDGNGTVTTIQLVGSGNTFDVGHAALASMMIARDKGLPVKAVAVFVRDSDVGLLAPAESGIKGPADLKGKKVAYTAGSLESPFIDPFLAAGKLKRDDLELINVDAAGKLGTYLAGRADAVFSTIPFVLPSANAARKSNAIRFADYGLTMPSFGLLASEAKLAEKGPAIGTFASVVARAWEYVLAGHEDEAVQAIIAQRPQAKLNPAVLRGQIDALKGFFGKPVAGSRLGVPVPQDWVDGAKTLQSAGLISGKLAATDYYVTGLVAPERFDALVGK